MPCFFMVRRIIYRKDLPKTVRAFEYQRGKTNKSIDRELTALKPGKRVSKTGNTYFESRKNRSDLNPKTRL